MKLERGFGKKLFGWMGGLLCLLAPVASSVAANGTLAPEANMKVNSAPASGLPLRWVEFHSTPGNCSLNFPTSPEHISEKLVMAEEGYELKYDAYISAADQQSIFLLLVAQYPEFVDEAYAQMSLEGFLNGILTHNPSNQLLFADLLLVDGHEALDFFIRAGNIYFKGRAVMVKNSLYLMAMECEIPNYDEVRYNHFVESFKLHSKVAAAK